MDYQQTNFSDEETLALLHSKTVPGVSTPVVIVSLLVPWSLFVFSCGLLSFTMHYNTPQYAWMVIAVLFAIPVLFGFIATKANNEGRSAAGWKYSAFASALALCLGSTMGDMNYWFNAQPYYDIQTMNAYWNVDPSKSRGQQHMDAGRVYFKDNARIDPTKAMAFRNLDTYCVAPIVSDAAQTTQDWWAVGLNCCTSGSSFTCGDVRNPKARAGLRAMRDEQRPFFRLAVHQAEAEYGVSAQHPLFFYWMEDPAKEVLGYLEEANRLFTSSAVSFGILNAFLVALVVVGVSRLAPVKRRV
mmetsp:Transcript_17055/g.41104  ORF Transcript_17055/g.41104 Transcript_17055/m.41104 type:complete len:300 (+) Transcript_17055:66-965(+)